MNTLLRPLLTLGFISAVSVSGAAQVNWLGSQNNDFESLANWSALPANDLTSNISLFGSAVTANQPQLSASRSINGLLFSSASGGWILGSASPSHILTLGGSGISTAGQTSGSDTVSMSPALPSRRFMRLRVSNP